LTDKIFHATVFPTKERSLWPEQNSRHKSIK
jgi:hypothetical protein